MCQIFAVSSEKLYKSTKYCPGKWIKPDRYKRRLLFFRQVKKCRSEYLSFKQQFLACYLSCAAFTNINFWIIIFQATDGLKLLDDHEVRIQLTYTSASGKRKGAIIQDLDNDSLKSEEGFVAQRTNTPESPFRAIFFKGI